MLFWIKSQKFNLYFNNHLLAGFLRRLSTKKTIDITQQFLEIVYHYYKEIKSRLQQSTVFHVNIVF